MFPLCVKQQRIVHCCLIVWVHCSELLKNRLIIINYKNLLAEVIVVIHLSLCSGRHTQKQFIVFRLSVKDRKQ